MPVPVGSVVSTKPTMLCCCQHAPSPSPPPPHSICSLSSFQQKLRLQEKFSPRLQNLPAFSQRRNLGLSICSSSSDKSFCKKPSSSPSPSVTFLLSNQPAGFVSNCVAHRSHGPSLRNLALSLSSAASFAFLGSGGGAALAEEVVMASQDGAETTDYVLVFLFIAAFVGLAVLTIGVIYLSVSDFQEKRQLTEQQKALGEEKLENSERVKVSGPKGFGPKKIVDPKAVKSK